ncbi:unnamed protein product [Bursaphelenchus xylophilus]|uniref:(pine wood nematode) hypothetical protein n=1 Tax=Bursaphelenchus xylophilus TaxID=6326 RepID=A0A7I8X4V6_BURXY|nr:unnamed protein product [Bursaphelenchus xylophilus]CAG9129170.1 unnamed protein product [Bursaphelenchus xylophilus]
MYRSTSNQQTSRLQQGIVRLPESPQQNKPHRPRLDRSIFIPIALVPKTDPVFEAAEEPGQEPEDGGQNVEKKVERTIRTHETPTAVHIETLEDAAKVLGIP